MKRGAEHLICCASERDTGRAERCVLTVEYLTLVIEAVECGGEVEYIPCDKAGLVLGEGITDTLGEAADTFRKLKLKLAEGYALDFAALVCALENRAGTRIGVLHIRTCIAVKGECLLHNKVYISHTVVREVVEDNSANTDLLGNFLTLALVGVLLLGYVEHARDSLGEKVL